MDGKNGAGRQRLSRCQEAFARGLAQGRGLCGAYRAAYRCGGLEDGPADPAQGDPANPARNDTADPAASPLAAAP